MSQVQEAVDDRPTTICVHTALMALVGVCALLAQGIAPGNPSSYNEARTVAGFAHPGTAEIAPRASWARPTASYRAGVFGIAGKPVTLASTQGVVGRQSY